MGRLHGLRDSGRRNQRLRDPNWEPSGEAMTVSLLCLSSHDEADEIITALFIQLLCRSGFVARQRDPSKSKQRLASAGARCVSRITLLHWLGSQPVPFGLPAV